MWKEIASEVKIFSVHVCMHVPVCVHVCALVCVCCAVSVIIESSFPSFMVSDCLVIWEPCQSFT